MVLASKTVAELKEMLRERNLPVSGNKPDLIARLSASSSTSTSSKAKPPKVIRPKARKPSPAKASGAKAKAGGKAKAAKAGAKAKADPPAPTRSSPGSSPKTPPSSPKPKAKAPGAKAKTGLEEGTLVASKTTKGDLIYFQVRDGFKVRISAITAASLRKAGAPTVMTSSAKAGGAKAKAKAGTAKAKAAKAGTAKAGPKAGAAKSKAGTEKAPRKPKDPNAPQLKAYSFAARVKLSPAKVHKGYLFAEADEYDEDKALWWMFGSKLPWVAKDWKSSSYEIPHLRAPDDVKRKKMGDTKFVYLPYRVMVEGVKVSDDELAASTGKSLMSCKYLGKA